MKYRNINLGESVIGVTYIYTPQSSSNNYDLPDNEPVVKIESIDLISGDLMEVIDWVDVKAGEFYKWLDEFIILEELSDGNGS